LSQHQLALQRPGPRRQCLLGPGRHAAGETL